MKYIKYKPGYKYQLHEDYNHQVKIYPDVQAKTDYIHLSVTGTLTLKKGYAWDGPSGPAIDTPNFMRGSLVHDALYQLLRMDRIDSKWKKEADMELKKICIQDGMSKIRAWAAYCGVRAFGWPATLPENVKPVLKAPR